MDRNLYILFVIIGVFIISICITIILYHKRINSKIKQYQKNENTNNDINQQKGMRIPPITYIFGIISIVLLLVTTLIYIWPVHKIELVPVVSEIELPPKELNIKVQEDFFNFDLETICEKIKESVPSENQFEVENIYIDISKENKYMVIQPNETGKIISIDFPNIAISYREKVEVKQLSVQKLSYNKVWFSLDKLTFEYKLTYENNQLIVEQVGNHSVTSAVQLTGKETALILFQEDFIQKRDEYTYSNNPFIYTYLSTISKPDSYYQNLTEAEAKAEIKKDYFIKRQTLNRTDNTIDDVTIRADYGNYNGSYVLIIAYKEDGLGWFVMTEITIGEVELSFPSTAIPCVWNKGIFYSLEEAYTLGLITQDNLQTIAKIS